MLPLLFKAPRNKKYIPKMNVTFVKITKKTQSHTQTVTLLTADGRTCSSFFLLKRRVLFYNFADFINFYTH